MDGVRHVSVGANLPLPLSLDRPPNPQASPAAVAQGFESIFAAMIIKQMRQTMDGESVFGKDPGDVVGGLFDQFMGQHLARAGGIGIGAMVRSQLERRSNGT